MDAEIIAVGSELLTPHHLDTNSLYLTKQLNLLGIEVKLKTVVGDHHEQIAEVLRAALQRSAIIIVTGGLGPTEDDMTREVFSEVLGYELREVEEIRRQIEARFKKIGRKMASINLRQAQVPKSAIWLKNTRATAPGLWLKHNNAEIILLPGPPRELEFMFETDCMERLRRIVPERKLVTQIYKVADLTESEVDERIAPIYKPCKDLITTILSSPGEIEIHLKAAANSKEAAKKIIAKVGKKIEKELGWFIFSSCGETLEETVGKLLRKKEMTIALAEGSTGGRVSKCLTQYPGSSEYFLGGVICYSHASKTQLAGLPLDLIRSEGSVSQVVCRALAEGVRLKTGASLGLAITGLCGPGGSTADKPLGLTYVGLAGKDGSEVREFRFTGEREKVQRLASQASLNWVRKRLME